MDIVRTFECNADEVAEHGFFSHYQTYMVNDLKKVGFSKTETQDILLSYMFMQKAERERFLRHIVAGVMETRPALFHVSHRREFKDVSTKTLGIKLLDTQLSAFSYIGEKSVVKGLDILQPLSMKSATEKQEILTHINTARKTAETQSVDAGVRQMTDSLVPYFFKEATPFLNKKENDSDMVALYTSFYARQDKFFRIRRLVESFAFLFLTQQDYEQEESLRSFSQARRKIATKTFPKIPEVHQNQR